MKVIRKFYQEIEKQLEDSLKQEGAIMETTNIFYDSIINGGVIHVFGCGHSQMFGQELCFRTGGLVPVNAIMIPQFCIFPTAAISQKLERSEGMAESVFQGLNHRPEDVMLIVSVSGRNAAVIDMAITAKEKGMKVIALTSINYSNSVTSRHSSGKLLKDFADVVLDLPGVSGDAVLSHPKVANAFCSPSTIVGMSILSGIIGETVVKLAENDHDPMVWVSGNLDKGDKINAEYVKKYKGRVNIL